jgi:hypothetical protein
MNLLLKHHFAAGWRNILKYKAQNIISVLCLAVGIVVFAVTFWLIVSTWNQYYTQKIDYDGAEITISSTDTLERNPQYEKYIALLQTLQSVERVSFETVNNKVLYAMCKIEGDTLYRQSFSYRYVSPDWCETHRIRSATTGKQLGRLKIGTVLMPERTYKRYYAHYIPHPVGSKIQNTTRPMQIDDLINTDWQVTGMNDLLVVSDGREHLVLADSTETDYQFIFYPIRVTLKAGYTIGQFEAETLRKMPEVKVSVVERISEKLAVASFLALCIGMFMGASVLIIGLSGYLKMQIQLFYLRHREMMLRRCNGAKPYQLFLLLACEMLITFALVLLVAMILSLALYAYAMPRIQIVEQDFYMPTDLILRIESWIALFAFVLSTLICWVSSRKVMRTPVGQAVGKGYVPKTRWRGAMQVTQYFVGTILLLLILTLFAMAWTQWDNYGIHGNLKQYREAVLFNYADNDSLQTLPSVKHVARIARLGNAYVVDPATMQLMGATVERDSSALRAAVPVCAEPSEAVQVCRQLGIAYRPFRLRSMEHDRLLKDKVAIGYVSRLDIHKQGPEFSMYWVRPHMTLALIRQMLMEAEKDSLTNFWPVTIVFPKEGMHDAMCDEIGKRFVPNYVKGNYRFFTPAYDRFFEGLVALSLIRQLCYVLFLVGIISIVLTVYSSVSLETRGRQKEVAIRKVNGAKTRDIILLFCQPYIRTLGVAYVLVIISDALIGVLMHQGAHFTLNNFVYMTGFYFLSIFIITLVTFLTIWRKIYKVAKTRPAGNLIQY